MGRCPSWNVIVGVKADDRLYDDPVWDALVSTYTAKAREAGGEEAAELDDEEVIDAYGWQVWRVTDRNGNQHDIQIYTPGEGEPVLIGVRLARGDWDETEDWDAVVTRVDTYRRLLHEQVVTELQQAGAPPERIGIWIMADYG